MHLIFFLSGIANYIESLIINLWYWYFKNEDNLPRSPRRVSDYTENFLFLEFTRICRPRYIALYDKFIAPIT